MSFLRRSTPSIVASIRQITSSKPVKETAIRSAAIGSIPHLISTSSQMVEKKTDVGKSIVGRISAIRKSSPNVLLNISQPSMNLSNGKCVLASNSARVAKMFASFDLGSLSVTFAGYLGEFAVWAVTDLSTGELVYLVDDNC